MYIMLVARLEALFKKDEEYTIIEKMKGSTLVRRKYRPLFPYFQHLKSDHPGQGAFCIVRLGEGLVIVRLGGGAGQRGPSPSLERPEFKNSIVEFPHDFH